MLKKIFIFIIMCSNVIILNSKTDGPYLVSPEPPFCSDNDIGLLCASTACAMVMRYWGDLGIIKNMDCKGYAEEFAKAFGTSDGSAIYNPGLFKSAFEKVAKSLIDQVKYAVKTDSMHPQSFNTIKKHMKHSTQNDQRSPWDRPGVIVIYKSKKRTKFNRLTQNEHVVLAWGCKLEAKYKRGVLKRIKISYKFKDPAWRKANQTWRVWLPVKEIPIPFFVLWWPIKC